MLLAGLILLAACANLGSLFAARAADRSREVALRLALGSSRQRILRGLFTEAVLISLVGGAAGLWASVALLRWLSVWQPFGNFPMHAAVNPDPTVYGIALLLTLVSGFLFGAVPVRQVLRTNPYEIVKSGSTGRVGRRFAVRDVLLVVQIAICAVLVTSSLVAVRGMVRALHCNFGFEPRNVVLVGADLHMAGYSGDSLAPMQKRMIDAVETMPGVESAGLTDALLLNDSNTSNVYADDSTDLRLSHAVATAYVFHISPAYLQAEGATLLSGRAFTWHDDSHSPRVAVVNREFARKILGSETNGIGSYYKMRDGTRVEVVGIAEDGKYGSLTEDPRAAMFLPLLQWSSNSTWMVVRSSHDPQQLGQAIRRTLRQLDAGMHIDIETRYDEMETVSIWPPYGDDCARCAGCDGRHAVHHWHLRNGCVLRQQAPPRVGNSRRARRSAERSLAGSLGPCFQIAGLWLRGRIAAGNSGDPSAGFHRVSGISAGSAGTDWCCSSYVPV